MKSLVVVVLTGIVLAGTAAAQVQITCQKKKADESAAATGGISPGSRRADSESVIHKITLANTSLKDLENLELRYMIFVKRERLGEKRGVEGKDHKSGHETIGTIKKGERREIETVPVELSSSQLVGEFHYKNGGRIKAQDSVSGVWIKLFQDQKMIAEYANPSTVKTREKWEDQ